MNIEIISGSPRTDSVTHRLALHLKNVLSEKTSHHTGIIDVRDYPLPMLQKVFVSPGSAPAEFRSLAERMFAANAFILVSPEYNGSYSPALKNLFDHFPKQVHKTFGIVTGSTGPMGGMRATQVMQLYINALFGIACPYMLVVPHADKKFDEGGNLLEASFQANVDNFVHEFVWLAEKICPRKKHPEAEVYA